MTSPEVTLVIKAQPPIATVVVKRPTATLVIKAPGPPGPQGDQGVEGPEGPQGPTGPPGSAATLNYIHNQNTPASVWTIDHNLGFYPAVTVEDSAGSVVEGEIGYPSGNRVVLTFSGSFSGKAYLS